MKRRAVMFQIRSRAGSRGKGTVPCLRHAAEDGYRVCREHAEHRLRQWPPQDSVLRALAGNVERRAAMLSKRCKIVQQSCRDMTGT